MTNCTFELDEGNVGGFGGFGEVENEVGRVLAFGVNVQVRVIRRQLQRLEKRVFEKRHLQNVLENIFAQVEHDQRLDQTVKVHWNEQKHQLEVILPAPTTFSKGMDKWLNKK